MKQNSNILNFWGEFSQITTEHRYIRSIYHDLNHHNRLVLLVAGLGYFFVIISDYFRLNISKEFYITSCLRSAYLIFCICVFFILRKHNSIQLNRKLLFIAALSNVVLLTTLMFFLNQDRQLDFIDHIIILIVTLLFYVFLYLPLIMLLIYGAFVTISYIILLFLFYDTSIYITIPLLIIMLSVNILGFSLNRFIKTIKRKDYIHKLTIEELNYSLKAEIKERIKIQNNLETVLKEITDSIRYAQKIQFALLPDESILTKKFKESALLFMPKNIVSGDFYWIYEIQDKTIVALADCTGHGIPGAFMSVLGISLLNDIIKNAEEQNSNIETDKLLYHLRESVVRSLRHTVVNYDRRDGMDIALIIVDHKEKYIQFSGAYMPLWLVRKNGGEEAELIEYTGDKMSVGFYSVKEVCNYSIKEIHYQDDDIIYLFSDGFRDQFGGEKGKKFLAKRMRRMFLDNYDVPLDKQQELWRDYYQKWKGDREQVDDILIMGLKL